MAAAPPNPASVHLRNLFALANWPPANPSPINRLRPRVSWSPEPRASHN